MLACRPMLCFAVAAMAGVVAARAFPEAAPYAVHGWPVLLLLAAWFALTPRPAPPPVAALPPEYEPLILPRPGFLARRGLNRCILIACLGLFLLAAMRQEGWRRELSPARLPEARWFDATLVALAPSRDHAGEQGRWRVPALLLTAGGKDAGSVPVRLSGPEGPAFRRGDVVVCRVRNDPPRPPAFPGAFDFAFWLERDGLVTALAVQRPRRATAGDPGYAVAAMDDVSLFTRARRAVDALRARAVFLTLGYGGDHGGVLAAMLYGYRKDIADELRDCFRRVGIGHVLAISGLHVGLIVGLLWWLSGWLGWTARWRAAACLALAVLYLGLSGGQVAAARATLMAVIHLAGIALGRRSDMANSLGAAAFILTFLNPTAPLDVSFQLSFTAVVFIFMAFQRDQKPRPLRPPGAPRWRRRAWEGLSSLTRLSVTTWAGLFPIIALVFNQVNPAGLPVNIVVIPLMSLVLAGGLLLPALGWLPGAPAVLTAPTLLLAAIARLADRLPYSSFAVNPPGAVPAGAFYLFALALLLRGLVPPGRPRRLWTRTALAGAAFAFLAMAAGMGPEPPPAGGRIACLPGRGPGVMVVEAPGGDIVLFGHVERGGLNEARWLHSLRRGGRVRVVRMGEAAKDDLAALDYHYPVASVAGIAPVDPRPPAAAAWLPVDGAPEVEYAVSRDARGKVVWVAARTGDRSACAGERMTARQFAWRQKRRTPGFDATLLLAAFKGRDIAPPDGPAPPGRVAVGGRFPGSLPAGWFRRAGYGALVVEDGIQGFDGVNWRRISD